MRIVNRVDTHLPLQKEMAYAFYENCKNITERPRKRAYSYVITGDLYWFTYLLEKDPNNDICIIDCKHEFDDSFGGIILGGTTTTMSDALITGGIILGGYTNTDIHTLHYSYGGIILGGISPTHPFEPTKGGIIFGGKDFTNVLVKSSGGLLLGGHSLFSLDSRSVGGIIEGGKTISLNVIKSSGGIILGGTSISGFTKIQLSSGGILFGGKELNLTSVHSSGGIHLGGNSITYKDIRSTGGIIFGGYSETDETKYRFSYGGVLFGGTTNYTHKYVEFRDSFGGIVLGGNTILQGMYIIDNISKGGVFFGGYTSEIVQPTIKITVKQESISYSTPITINSNILDYPLSDPVLYIEVTPRIDGEFKILNTDGTLVDVESVRPDVIDSPCSYKIKFIPTDSSFLSATDTFSLNITPRHIGVLLADPRPVIYNGQLQYPTTISYSAPFIKQDADILTYTSNPPLTKHVGIYYVTAHINELPTTRNYTGYSNEVIFIIKERTLEKVLGNNIETYNGLAHSLDISFRGILDGDSIDPVYSEYYKNGVKLDGPPIDVNWDGATEKPYNVTTYITNNDYASSYNSTLTILRADQKVYGMTLSSPFSYTGIIDNGSNDPFYSWTRLGYSGKLNNVGTLDIKGATTPIVFKTAGSATIAGNKLTAGSLGTSFITYESAGNSNYKPATNKYEQYLNQDPSQLTGIQLTVVSNEIQQYMYNIFVDFTPPTDTSDVLVGAVGTITANGSNDNGIIWYEVVYQDGVEQLYTSNTFIVKAGTFYVRGWYIQQGIYLTSEPAVTSTYTAAVKPITLKINNNDITYTGDVQGVKCEYRDASNVLLTGITLPEITYNINPVKDVATYTFIVKLPTLAGYSITTEYSKPGMTFTILQAEITLTWTPPTRTINYGSGIPTYPISFIGKVESPTVSTYKLETWYSWSDQDNNLGSQLTSTELATGGKALIKGTTNAAPGTFTYFYKGYNNSTWIAIPSNYINFVTINVRARVYEIQMRFTPTDNVNLKSPSNINKILCMEYPPKPCVIMNKDVTLGINDTTTLILTDCPYNPTATQLRVETSIPTGISLTEISGTTIHSSGWTETALIVKTSDNAVTGTYDIKMYRVADDNFYESNRFNLRINVTNTKYIPFTPIVSMSGPAYIGVPIKYTATELSHTADNFVYSWSAEYIIAGSTLQVFPMAFSQNLNTQAVIFNEERDYVRLKLVITKDGYIPKTVYSNGITVLAKTAAQITSPANGSSFSGTSVSFIWNTLPYISNYLLEVGTGSVGAHNLYRGGTSGNTITVDSLPETGEKLYVRLSSLYDASYHSVDYIYTLYGGVPTNKPPQNSGLRHASIENPDSYYAWPVGIELYHTYEIWNVAGTEQYGGGGYINAVYSTPGIIDTNDGFTWSNPTPTNILRPQQRTYMIPVYMNIINNAATGIRTMIPCNITFYDYSFTGTGTASVPGYASKVLEFKISY